MRVVPEAVDPGLRLSAQRALLGAITPNIRLVKVTRQSQEIVFTAVAAAPLTDSEREALSIAAAEIISDFPDCTIREEVIVSTKPIPAENILTGGWVFLRAE